MSCRGGHRFASSWGMSLTRAVRRILAGVGVLSTVSGTWHFRAAPAPPAAPSPDLQTVGSVLPSPQMRLKHPKAQLGSDDRMQLPSPQPL